MQIGYVGEEANNYQLGNRALYCVKGSQKVVNWYDICGREYHKINKNFS